VAIVLAIIVASAMIFASSRAPTGIMLDTTVDYDLSTPAQSSVPATP
jgi:hypothetical protein